MGEIAAYPQARIATWARCDDALKQSIRRRHRPSREPRPPAARSAQACEQADHRQALHRASDAEATTAGSRRLDPRPRGFIRHPFCRSNRTARRPVAAMPSPQAARTQTDAKGLAGKRKSARLRLPALALPEFDSRVRPRATRWPPRRDDDRDRRRERGRRIRSIA